MCIRDSPCTTSSSIVSIAEMTASCELFRLFMLAKLCSETKSGVLAAAEALAIFSRPSDAGSLSRSFNSAFM